MTYSTPFTIYHLPFSRIVKVNDKMKGYDHRFWHLWPKMIDITSFNKFLKTRHGLKDNLITLTWENGNFFSVTSASETPHQQ